MRHVIDVIATLLVVFHLIPAVVQFDIFGLDDRQADWHMLIGAGVGFKSRVIGPLLQGVPNIY